MKKLALATSNSRELLNKSLEARRLSAYNRFQRSGFKIGNVEAKDIKLYGHLYSLCNISQKIG